MRSPSVTWGGGHVTFHGNVGDGSWSGTDRRNLPPAVSPHSTYREVRVTLRIKAEIDEPLS